MLVAAEWRISQTQRQLADRQTDNRHQIKKQSPSGYHSQEFKSLYSCVSLFVGVVTLNLLLYLFSCIGLQQIWPSQTRLGCRMPPKTRSKTTKNLLDETYHPSHLQVSTARTKTISYGLQSQSTHLRLQKNKSSVVKLWQNP